MEFNHSPQALLVLDKLKKFIDDEVAPLETILFNEQSQPHDDWTKWQTDSRIETLKTEAKHAGLWNLFLPPVSGLSNSDYAPMAEMTGWWLIAPEIFNCNAPDTGNMEVLWKYGSEEQKNQWLNPLLEGKVRSAFCMTEPDVASSDATNMQATVTLSGDKVILNGKKWWSTGLGHPNCKVAIFMGLSNEKAESKYLRHSMVLVPLNAKGVTIKRMLPVFNTYDAPYGHGEVHFDNVSLPKTNVIGGIGRGFEIAQGRLGPGRIHHCMRLIGAAERALKLTIERGMKRVAFGRPLIKLNANTDIVAKARMDIDMARLLVLKTAWMLDTVGVMGAMSEVSQIKAVVPGIACRIIDQAIQMHGGAGLSNDTPLAALYGYARVLRLADGPDEVHRALVAKIELQKYR